MSFATKLIMNNSGEIKNQNPSIDVASLVQDARHFIDSVCLEKFNDVLQAIAKRQVYSQYYYQLFLESSTPMILFKDRFGVPNSDFFSARDIFEANLLAFIDNLHALIDAFPYLASLAYPLVIPPETIIKKPMSIKWDEDFIKKFNDEGVFDKMNYFFEDPHFKLLKNLCNHGKHKYPVKLKNNVTDIYFDDLDGYISNAKLSDSNIPVKYHMDKFHDELLPRYFELINLMHEDLKSRKMMGVTI